LGEDGSTYLASNLLDPVARAQQPVVERVQAPQAEAFVSQASLREMAIKASIGRLQVDLPELERQVPLQGFRWLPISNAHLLAVADLGTDGIHLDPWSQPCPSWPALLTQGRWLSLKLKTLCA
jgi:PIN domain nuclease of toxin-antitoxin system